MACYLLKNDWSIDEVKRRLGHKPSSYVIDKYVNYLAIDRHKPKKKIYQNNLQKVVDDLEEIKKREQLSSRRIERLQEENKLMLEAIKKGNKEDAELNPEFVKLFDQLQKEMTKQKKIIEEIKNKK